MEPSFLSLLPSLLAISLAILTRQVYLSLIAGIFSGYAILAADPIKGMIDSVDGVFAVLQSPGDARVLAFTLMIGGLLATIEASGGVRGFVQLLESRRWVNTARRSQWLAWIVGVILFIESSITVLVAGAVSRPLFDRFQVSREKLAYIIDSTSAPVCILIPLNAWGAFNLGLLQKSGVEEPLKVFLSAIPLNLYAFAALILSALCIALNINFKQMRRAEERTQQGRRHWNTSFSAEADMVFATDEAQPEARAVNMLLPIISLVLAMPVCLWISGNGDMTAGSGSTSVFWSVLIALCVSWLLLLIQRTFSVDELTQLFMKGAGELLPIALVLLLALALGSVTVQLQTGVYVAILIGESLEPALLLPMVFLVSACIAFSTGSSWGTFAIMIPIIVPAADAMTLPLAVFVAAVLSGGIFGDHSSPISDTTILSSLAAATNHIEHVRTQLPYALLAGALSVSGFAVIGSFL